MTRIGIFGWGIIAPRSPDIEAFAANLERGGSWLEPFDGFGPCNFLVGFPELRFERYRPWIDARFPPARYSQIVEKMDPTSLHAIAAFIQALGQNPGIEEELRSLGVRTHVYVGCGLGNLPTIASSAVSVWRAQRRWDRFWADPARHPDLSRYRDGDPEVRAAHPGAPPDPAGMTGDREDAEEAWDHYWASCSPALREYLADQREAESVDVVGNVESAKLNAIRLKQQRFQKLQARWKCPEPPWRSVSANLLWNISSMPAAQISMLGRIHGLSIAPVGACSTFGVTLKLAIDAIRRGEATAVVIGATDPPPHPMTVASFYAARVISADAAVSKPLSGLRGTHVSGGSAIWIVGDLDHFRSRGFKPLGMEPLAVGVSSDAHHIITPTKEGPLLAVRQALGLAGVEPSELGTWDLHATATPGDYLEIENLRDTVPGSVLVTARKGTFGHGMSACGGWELTAQYLGFAQGRLYPTPLGQSELNAQIARVHDRFVFDSAVPAPGPVAGKLSMGVGGVNACVLSRPLSD
jgi:3-oxoacyl-[acyl-carrier-protein] synthase II